MSNKNSVGLVGLIAIVFGSMIGSGIFSIPQNMAEQASIGAVSLAWLVTGIGML
ncbi:amino acid permease, partial [Vibrio sp. 10N.261.45.A4]